MKQLRRSRRKSDALIGEVALEGRWSPRAVGKGHVTVGPEQIERVAGKARILIFRPPAEIVQRQISRRAPGGKPGTDGAIDMDLPIHGGQRLEIIRAIGPHPWQAIAALDTPGCAAT